MASVLAFTGRLLFALLFISSGIQKLASYDHNNDGGPVAALVKTKLETFNSSVQDLTGVSIPFEQARSLFQNSGVTPSRCPLSNEAGSHRAIKRQRHTLLSPVVRGGRQAICTRESLCLQEHYKYLLLVAIATELLGALLFVLDSAAGAVLLILFLIGVTPTIHDFWNAKEGPLQQMEGAQFFKVWPSSSGGCSQMRSPSAFAGPVRARVGLLSHTANRALSRTSGPAEGAVLFGLSSYFGRAGPELAFLPLQNVALAGALLFYLGSRGRKVKLA